MFYLLIMMFVFALPFMLLAMVAVRIFMKGKSVFSSVREDTQPEPPPIGTAGEIKYTSAEDEHPVQVPREGLLSKLSKPKKLKGLDE